MLRLAAKVVAFFWRKADGPDEEAGPRGLELPGGASWGGAGAEGAWRGGARAGPGCGWAGALAPRVRPPRASCGRAYAQVAVSNLPERLPPCPGLWRSLPPFGLSVQCGLREAARAQAPPQEATGAGRDLCTPGGSCVPEGAEQVQ